MRCVVFAPAFGDLCKHTDFFFETKPSRVQRHQAVSNCSGTFDAYKRCMDVILAKK